MHHLTGDLVEHHDGAGIGREHGYLVGDDARHEGALRAPGDIGGGTGARVDQQVTGGDQVDAGRVCLEEQPLPVVGPADHCLRFQPAGRLDREAFDVTGADIHER